MEITDQANTRNFWAEKILEKIQVKTNDYSEREKENTRVSFLVNAVEKIPQKENIEPLNWDEFQEKTENVISLLPEKPTDGKMKYGNYLKTITNYKSYVQQKFNYVSKGFYTRIWLVIGIALGLPIGAIFGHISLGIPFGIGIGLVVGTFLDKKAIKENRVL